MDNQTKTQQVVAPKKRKRASYHSEEAINVLLNEDYEPGIYRNTVNGMELLMPTLQKANDIRMLPDWEFVRKAKNSDFKEIEIDLSTDIQVLRDNNIRLETANNDMRNRIYDLEKKLEVILTNTKKENK